MSILSILNQVASTASKNEKIAILTANKDNAVLKEVCRLAYDPTVNFYIRQIPDYQPSDTPYPLATMLAQLSKLSMREKTGSAAVAHLQDMLCMLDSEDAIVLSMIIDRDLRAGFSDSTANKVWKDLIPEYPYMRCSLPKKVKLETLSWKAGVYSQLKADGMFANVNLDADGEVAITSRSGTQFPLTQFGTLLEEIKNTFEKGTQSHGELLVKRDGDVLARQLGNGILNKVAQGGVLEATDEIVYMVWDNIPLSSVKSKGEYNVGYKDRFAKISKQVSNSTCIILAPTRIVHNMDEALVHYREQLAEGLEGTIIKCGNGGWKDSTSKYQVKMKLEITVDLVIKGLTPGKGKNADTFGSVNCQTSDGLLEVNVSGFSDEMRLEIFNNFANLNDTIMAVTSNSIMPPSGNNSKYSLFLPRFAEFRQDKKVADTMVQVQDQFDSAIK